MPTYKIVRFYREDDHPAHGSVIETGLTLAEAKEHCKREDSCERDGDGVSIWFDGWTEED